MSVIPLTLTISLCLVFTFVIFFLREHSRHRFSSAESDALLPLAEETPRLVTMVASRGAVTAAVSATHEHAHEHGANCGCSRGERAPCAGCRNRVAASR